MAISEITIDTIEPFADGKVFGAAGSYIRIKGITKGEINPLSPENHVIADLDKAPRNAVGMVEYETDFFILRPAEPGRASGVLVYDVTNRGRKMIFNPFLVLATGSSQGLDCSPKGDKPGFVQVEDDGRTLLIPDRRGNNRIDSIKNVVEDPRVALIFLVPGANETYRVNGRARVSVDPALKQRFAVDGKEPTTVIVIAVDQAFQHCPKALVRSNLWKAGTGERPQGVPTLGDFAAARTPGTDSSTYDADYARRMPSELY